MFVAKMCSKMAEDDVPHNVAFVRGKPVRHSTNSLSDSNEYPIRVYIWPRRPTLGARVNYYQTFPKKLNWKFECLVTYHFNSGAVKSNFQLNFFGSNAATPKTLFFRVTQISIVL